MIPTVKKGDSFYFSNDHGTIYICVDYLYRPDGVTIKTYKTALAGRLYPIYISAKTMEKAIVIKTKTSNHATHTI
jgi:hypothetical protein